MTTLLAFLTALTLTMRALAIVAGSLVALDSVKIYTGHEHPPHNPRKNAMAWFVVGGCSALGALMLIYTAQPTINLRSTLFGAFAICFVWTALPLALVMRASIRSERPHLIWISACLFVFAGVFLTWTAS